MSSLIDPTDDLAETIGGGGGGGGEVPSAPVDTVQEGGEAIRLKVVTQDGSEVVFKCKMTTPLSMLMNAFCERQGGPMPGCFRFLFDGERLNGSETPAEMRMEDGDTIDVMRVVGWATAAAATAAVGQAIGAVGQVTSLEIGDHIEVLDEEKGWLLFRIYHLVAKPDGLHDVRVVKENELDYLLPPAERTPRGRTADYEICFLRDSDGNLTFPEDVRPASPSTVCAAQSGGAECEGECGALVWAVAFEELVPEYTLSADGLSIPGPGGTWRTEVEKKTLSDRFTYALTLVDPGGYRWRQSALKQLAERLFRNQPQQLKTAPSAPQCVLGKSPEFSLTCR